MTTPTQPRREKAESYLFFLFLALIAGWRFGLAFQPVQDAVQYTVADDMFYYMKMAQNWIAGRGWSFDGITATNGFHPLYSLLCAGVMALKLSREAATHLLLALSAGFGVLASLLVSWTVRRISGSWFAGLLALVLYGLNPYVISQDMNGMETALYGLLLAGTIASYIRIRQDPGVRLGAWVGFGALLGMTLLARTESIFLPAAFLLDGHIHRKSLSRSRFMLSMAIAAALFSPWVVWNLARFGTFIQDSGASIPYYNLQKQMLQLGHPLTLADHARNWLQNTNDNLLVLLAMFPGIPVTLAKKYSFFFLVLPWLGLGVLAWRGWWRNLPAAVKQWPVLTAFPAMIFLYYSLVHGVSHWRYFYAILMLGMILVLAAIQPGPGFLKSRWRHAVLAVLALYTACASWLLILHWKNYPWQGTMVAAARWMEANLPPEARIGAFNGGIFGFWSGRQVVNLDGVVNHDMLAVMRGKQISLYLKQQGIGYLCDYHSAVEDYLEMFSDPGKKPALRPIHKMARNDGSGLQEDLVLYEIAW